MEEFFKAKNMFTAALNIESKLSFEEWMKLPDDYKAAALYVNFFDNITMAYAKCADLCVDENDALSTLLQYLEKNVAIIMEHPERYKPAYIFTVSKNAMSPLRRIQKNRDRVTYVKSPEINDTWNSQRISGPTIEDGINCAFAYLEDPDQTPIDDDRDYIRDEIDTIIGKLDKTTLSVIDHLIYNVKLGKKGTLNYNKIVADLKKLLIRYKDELTPEHHTIFADIIDCEEIIESAVVEMRDRTQAVYLGEKRVSNVTGKTEYVFFGPEQDYVISEQLAKDLRVISTELYEK